MTQFYWQSRTASAGTRLLDIAVEQSKKEGLFINCKKTECIVVCKRERPRCRLKIGEIEIKQVRKFNYLGRIITEDGKCDGKIRRRIGIAKEAFQKLSNNLCDRKLSMETKKRVLECYVKTTLVYIWQWMLDDIIVNAKETGGSGNVVL